MSANPANQPSQGTNSGRDKLSKKKTKTRGQLAIQAAAAASDQESEEISTANNRKLRDTMAAKNGRVAETILRERALGEEFVAGGGTLTDGNNAEARLKKLGVPVDAAGRSPSSLVAAASSSPLSEQDRFSYSRGPPKTPTRTPSHLSTVAQPSDTPPNPSHATVSHHPPPITTASSSARTANPSLNIVPATAPSASETATTPATATATTTAQAGSRGNAPSNAIPPPRSMPTTSGSNPSRVNTAPTAPEPSSSTRPATVLNSNLIASMPGTLNPSTNTLEDPWAPITNVPVRVEVVKTEDVKNPLAPTTTLYVTVPSVTRLGDHYTCKLSDIMTRVADLESPLKQRTSKVYRLGPDNELVRLGRGNDLADPSNTRLASDAFLNNHRINRVEKEGVEVFTGIKIFYERDPLGPSVRPPQDFFDEDPRPRRDRSTSQQERTNRSVSKRPTANTSGSASRSVSQHSTANASTSTSRNKHHRRQPSPSSPDEDDAIEGPFNPEDELYPFIRNIFSLQSNNLPGHWDVRTARDALNRYRSVCQGETLANELRWKIPGDESLTVLGGVDHEDRDVEVPEAIRGRAFTKTDLQRVFGFNDTTWWTLGQRWTKSSLKGARTVQAWVEDPDATVQNSDEEEEKYPHLNRLPFNKLKSVISLDRAGKYTRLGPKADRSSDSGEHVAREGGRRREDRSADRARQREQRRRQSSSSHHSRSPSAHLGSSELDDPDPRQGRKTGSRRSGGR